MDSQPLDPSDLTASEPFASAPGAAEEPRRPRIGLMGEFSAGKSTLSNLLIGAPALPVKVTATQLPPVWLSYGEDAPYRVRLDGSPEMIDLDRLSEVPVEETLYVRVFQKADMLEMCDLIDFPGISDPNMPSEVWERVAPMVDSVLWLTHATQAWRQSEAAVWETMPAELHRTSFLLLTRIDKILNDRDRARVESRVRRETAGLFADVFPVSLLRASEAGDDRAEWEASGAEALTRALIDQIIGLSERLGRPVSIAAPFAGVADPQTAPAAGPAGSPRGAEVVPLTRDRPVSGFAPAPSEPADGGGRVMPRRVALKRSASRSRPLRSG